MRQGMFTLSGAPSTTSHFDVNILSILHYLGSPLALCTLNFDLMRNFYIYNACTYILLFKCLGRIALLCGQIFVPEAILNQVAIKLLGSGLLTGHNMLCLSDFTSLHILYLYLISSVQIICHFNILLTEAGVMHEAGYVYSIWSTLYPFSF